MISADGGEPPETADNLWHAPAGRTVVIPRRSSLKYDETTWRDALVIVLTGRVELETIAGAHRNFGAGDILFFSGLHLRTVHNRGNDDVLLQVLARGESQLEWRAP